MKMTPKTPFAVVDFGEATCLDLDPIGLVAEEHVLQLELCNLLEALADGLPHEFDRRLAELVISNLQSITPAHTRLEEEGLFPLLRVRAKDVPALMSALDRLEDEHDRDADLLEELVSVLGSVLENGRPENPNMLGYLLRGYFESQRRHIAWEESVVLPVAREMLSKADLVTMQDWINQSGGVRCCRQSLLKLLQERAAAAPCGRDPRSAKSPTPGTTDKRQ